MSCFSTSTVGVRVSGLDLRAVANLASGWTVGSPESEEGQNRIITVRNDAVVVSVDYRKSISPGLHDGEAVLCSHSKGLQSFRSLMHSMIPMTLYYGFDPLLPPERR